MDRHGHVAVFSTAGSGPVPVEAISRVAEMDAAFDRLALLPVLGSAENILVDHAGDCSYWHAFSAKGFYAYDWNLLDGPHRRVCTPSVPISIGQLVAEIQAVARLAEFDVDFAGMAEIIWYEYAESLTP